jgi:hypothetical protein
MAVAKTRRLKEPAKASETKIPVFKAIPHPGRAVPGRAKPSPKPIVRNRVQALHQLEALLAAFSEVAEYEPRRLGNQPRPALWFDDPKYLSDVKALLGCGPGVTPATIPVRHGGSVHRDHPWSAYAGLCPAIRTAAAIEL